MKLLLASGGSGGHIYPGLAILEAIQQEDPSAQFVWVGTKRGLEVKIAKDRGIPYQPVHAWSVNNEGLIWRLQAYYFHGMMTLKLMNLMRREKIDAVITTGGYASASSLMAARLLRRPIFMHEQNVYPGMGTRMFVKHAKKVFTSFPGTEKNLPGYEEKVILAGNPVRDVFNTLEKETIRQEMDNQDKVMVLSVGGSLGANSINEFILSLKPLIEARDDLQWVHVYGNDKEEYESLFDEIKNLEAHRYIEDIPPYLVGSDLIITRSGAGMLTELSAMGKASILIPSPNVLDDHQSFNARLFEEEGAALLLKDEELLTPKARDVVENLLNDEELRDRLASKSKGIIPSHAAQKIAKEILESL